MLPLLLRQLGDCAEMRSSVEGRQPYLDQKLVEYMNTIPPCVSSESMNAPSLMSSQVAEDQAIERTKWPMDIY